MTGQVNHPTHYNSHPSGVECIDVIERWDFCTGNAFKYLFRAELKGAHRTDLHKAAFYIGRAFQAAHAGELLALFPTRLSSGHSEGLTRFWAEPILRHSLVWKVVEAEPQEWKADIFALLGVANSRAGELIRAMALAECDRRRHILLTV
jgi:hypothetical protein